MTRQKLEPAGQDMEAVGWGGVGVGHTMQGADGSGKAEGTHGRPQWRSNAACKQKKALFIFLFLIFLGKPY